MAEIKSSDSALPMKGNSTPSGFCSQQRSRSGRGNSHGPSRAKRCCTHEVHVEVAIVRAVALQLADRARREVAHSALAADLAQPLGSGVGRWLEPAVTLSKIPSKIAKFHRQIVENRLEAQSKSYLAVELSLIHI